VELVTDERRARIRELLVKATPAAPQVLRATTIGGSFALIIAGVWGMWGWSWAAIVAGAPGFGFYLWGEIRRAHTPAMEER
jgi:hypothetical protein